MGKPKYNKPQSRLAKRRRSTKEKIVRQAKRPRPSEPIEPGPIKQSLLDVFFNAGLFELTVKYCSTSTLGALMSVCKATFQAASKRLYRHLSYEDGDDPFFEYWNSKSSLDGPYSKAACLRHTRSLVLGRHDVNGCCLVPQNLDIVYLDVDPFLFCGRLTACDVIIDANPRVLIIRNLSTRVLSDLGGLTSFRHFYGNPRLEQVVLFAWDKMEFSTWQIDPFWPASNVVIICKGPTAWASQSVSSSRTTVEIPSSHNGSIVNLDRTPQDSFGETQRLSVGSTSRETVDDQDSTPILPPFVHEITTTVCRKPGHYNYKRLYTIVDAHLWDPRLLSHYDHRGSESIYKALQDTFNRFGDSNSRASVSPFRVLSESEFRDSSPDVASCIDQADGIFD